MGLGSPLQLLLLVLVVMVKGGESITNSEDISALKQIKNAIEPSSITPGSCLSTWDFSLDPCQTLFGDHFTCGFRCDITVSGESRVTELTLDPAGYSGTLSLSPLSFLQTLDLSDNLFSGEIPPTLSNLTSLRRLSLSRNSFSGPIPAQISSLSSLQELYLDNNLLSGPIPATFSNLQNLSRLELQSNKLSAEFPDLGSLKSLSFLDTSDNLISGKLPSTLPESLVEISMRNNALEGELPEISITMLTFLQVMDLSHNKLSGGLSSILFSHPSLQQLTLSHNHFTYLKVPNDYGINSELIALDLGYNDFEGFLPPFIAMMPTLSALSLESNRFTGMIPTLYGLKTALPVAGTSPFVRLLLSGNYLFGPIPSPLLTMKPGSATVSLVDNCLFNCPLSFFFCQGGLQKSLMACKSFSPVIP
ncbi:leucine-rich repeat (LRR) family protein [Tasmannia lanceolata]|uniref:leucine-rich repeat (LRR) family protein n=1 Tax=Tasmannia lanceolata TaxID=3420 RepID=UPI004063F689